jgi:hypothetical protein
MKIGTISVHETREARVGSYWIGLSAAAVVIVLVICMFLTMWQSGIRGDNAASQQAQSGSSSNGQGGQMNAGSVTEKEERGQILVQYLNATSDSEKQQIRQRASVILVRERKTEYINLDVVTPERRDANALRESIAKLQREPGVKFAEMQNTYAIEPPK